jgi:hypothetical protein
MSDTDPYLNIYSFNIATATAKRLSSGSTTWNEHAHYSPDGTTILWMSSTGLTPTTNGNYPTEYWAMNPDTTDQRQLSWFNTPGHQQYLQHLPVVSGDEDWNAAGNQFVGYVQVGLGTSNEMDYDVLVTFAPTNAEVASLPASAQFIYPAPVPSETNSAGYEPVELYAADTGGVTITRLTFSQFTHIHAAVSPDRLKIVSAVVLADTDGNGMLDAGDVKQLWVFDPASGTQHAIVTNYDAGFGGVDWSVDSQNIYCSMTQTYTNYDIYRINPTGSSVTPITTNLLTELGLAGDRKKISDTSVSPDGLWLAYSFAPPQGTTNFVAKNQIGICHLDGTSAQLVTDGGSLSAQQLGSQNVGDFGPSLAPGDQFVVFERVTTNGLVNNNPSGDIYSEQIATSKLTAISPTNQLVVSAYPDWSLDQRIVYTESNPSLERIGPVLARTNGTLIDRLNFAIDGSNFKWIAPAWPQSTLTLTGSASGQGILSWLASTNFNYQIQTTVNLYSNWVNLGSLYYGSNLTVTQAVNLYPATNRFYRLNIGVNAQTIDP